MATQEDQQALVQEVANLRQQVIAQQRQLQAQSAGLEQLEQTAAKAGSQAEEIAVLQQQVAAQQQQLQAQAAAASAPVQASDLAQLLTLQQQQQQQQQA